MPDLTEEKKAYLRNHLKYVRNAGNGATVAGFIEDHDPIGQKLLDEMNAEGLLLTDELGRLTISPKGHTF